MLNRALTIHESAGKAKDREWIHVLLHFLRAYVDSMGKDLLIGEEDSKAYIEGLVASLQDATEALDSGTSALDRFGRVCSQIRPTSETPFPDHSALSVSLVSDDAELAGSRDGSLLRVVVRNKLPCVSQIVPQGAVHIDDKVL